MVLFHPGSPLLESCETLFKGLRWGRGSKDKQLVSFSVPSPSNPGFFKNIVSFSFIFLVKMKNITVKKITHYIKMLRKVFML